MVFLVLDKPRETKTLPDKQRPQSKGSRIVSSAAKVGCILLAFVLSAYAVRNAVAAKEHARGRLLLCLYYAPSGPLAVLALTEVVRRLRYGKRPTSGGCGLLKCMGICWSISLLASTVSKYWDPLFALHFVGCLLCALASPGHFLRFLTGSWQNLRRLPSAGGIGHLAGSFAGLYYLFIIASMFVLYPPPGP